MLRESVTPQPRQHVLQELAVILEQPRDCFSHLIEQITLYCQKNRVRADAQEIAFRLWTFVHGAASLQIDQDYLVVAPDLDVNRLIVNATPGLLAPAPQSRKL